MSYTDFGPLHPKYVTGMFLKALQGNLIFQGQFLPERAVGAKAYTWHRYGRIGGMTPEATENGQLKATNVEYEERADFCKWYGEKAEISDFATMQMGLLRDVTRDHTEFLAQRLVLRMERERLLAIRDEPEIPATNIVDLSTDDKQWIGGTGEVSIVDDVINLGAKVDYYGKRKPDTVICGWEIGAQIIKETELRQWQLAGPFMQAILNKGVLPQGEFGSAFLGQMLGYKFFVSNVSIMADQAQEGGDITLNPLLRDEVIMFHSGAQLGALHVWQGTLIRSNPHPERERDLHVISIKKSMKPNIFRPFWIGKFTNAIA